MFLSLVKTSHLNLFCCVFPRSVLGLISRFRVKELEVIEQEKIGRTLLYFIYSIVSLYLKKSSGNGSMESSQAETTNGTDIEGLLSHRQMFGDRVCVSVFCLHIKFLTRKTAFNEFPVL